MPSIQLLLKSDDEYRLLGPRTKGRKTADVADRITTALLNGYEVPDTVSVEVQFSRCQISLPEPIIERLQTLSETSGRSVNFIVRNILDLDY